MKCPEWKFVGGEGIESIAYDRKEEVLFFKFWNNPGPYKYLHVNEEMFRELMAQEHKTTFFNRVMRSRYKEYQHLAPGYFEGCK